MLATIGASLDQLVYILYYVVRLMLVTSGLDTCDGGALSRIQEGSVASVLRRVRALGRMLSLKICRLKDVGARERYFGMWCLVG
jgi:hypothetical protein